jgi:hypothetical protein
VTATGFHYLMMKFFILYNIFFLGRAEVHNMAFLTPLHKFETSSFFAMSPETFIHSLREHTAIERIKININRCIMRIRIIPKFVDDVRYVEKVKSPILI